LFTFKNLFAKLLSANHPVIEIAYYRNLIASVPFLVAAFTSRRRDILLLRSKPVLVGARAAVGTLSLVTTFFAFSLMHAILQIVLRYLGRYERPETIAAYFFIVGTFLCALPLPFIAVRPSWVEMPRLFGWLIWQEWPLPAVMAGAAVVIGPNLLMILSY